MQVVILAGGFGTRISEESHLIPKPMIRIGDMPIILHIMKYYASFGHKDFIICAGYRQDVIKEYFSNYFLHINDIEFDFANSKTRVLKKESIDWNVKVIDTGLHTMTGGRIRRIKEYIKGETFMLTYGDGLSNININELLKTHNTSDAMLTLSAIRPGGRFGKLQIQSDSKINKFEEKHIDDGGWINGGFMVANISVLDFIESDSTVFEQEPLRKLSKENKLLAYKHFGFWQCMDTLRDKQLLEELYNGKDCPWTN